LLLRKVITISKSQRISSIADFISARYGKSTFLGGLVAFITVVGIIPYISLQLKAVSFSFNILVNEGALGDAIPPPDAFYVDTAFYAAVVLAVFTIFFGARHLEANERHQGLVAAIAFESLVKLIAFLAVGIFVTFGVYNGPGDLFTQAAQRPELTALFQPDEELLGSWNWFFLILISMFAVFLLPRQFHVAVVENENTHHLRRAIWLFPFYLLIINLFVLPIAFGGYMHFGESGLSGDTYVLDLPLAYGHSSLALLVFIGGVSAATGMVIVATTALGIMVSNNLLVPFLLRTSVVRETYVDDIFSRLIGLRRISVVMILLISYGYFRLVGENYSLVSIGLVSFVAVAQFAPAMLGGLYWKGANRNGAILGLLAGFMLWGFTLPFPSLAESGFISDRFLQEGYLGLSFLKPYSLFGMEGLSKIAHSAFWSLLFNSLFYLLGSLYSRASALEHAQASLFVDIYKYSESESERQVWKGKAFMQDIRLLLGRFLGKGRSEKLLATYARRHKMDLDSLVEADAELVNYAEKVLAGAIGTASARLLISSVVKEEPLGIREVMSMLDETQQLMRYSKALEKKSKELEIASRELKAANAQLQEMDRLKDEFLTTVTHELRTPMTSIRALSNIIHDKEDLPAEQRREFIKTIIQESERITRLINQVLDLEKMESGHAHWEMEMVDMSEIISQSLKGFGGLAAERQVRLLTHIPEEVPLIYGDHDRLVQVMINLVGNALKFCDASSGEVKVSLESRNDQLLIQVSDNGVGIPPEEQPYIFNKFTQFTDHKSGRPQGSGLGLSITWRIVVHHGGAIKVESEVGQGATFLVSLPLHRHLNQQNTLLNKK
jgi:signal transduction histidine kinase